MREAELYWPDSDFLVAVSQSAANMNDRVAEGALEEEAVVAMVDEVLTDEDSAQPPRDHPTETTHNVTWQNRKVLCVWPGRRFVAEAVWAIGDAASAVIRGAAELEAQVGQAQEEASASLSELKPAHSMWLQPSCPGQESHFTQVCRCLFR